MNVSDRDFDSARDDREPTLGTAASGPSAAPGAGGEETRRPSGDRARGGAAGAAGLPEADAIVDELLPEQVDWERLVRSYPLPALALAAAAGFYLAMARGPVVVSAVTGWAAGEMTRRVNDLVGEDLL